MKVLVFHQRGPAGLPEQVAYALREDMGVHPVFVEELENLDVLAASGFTAIVFCLDGNESNVMSAVHCLRTKKVSTPVLAVQLNRSADGEVSTLLDAGADAYLENPKHETEIVAYLHALVRRCASGATSSMVEYGHLRVDLKEPKVWVRDKRIELTPKEYRVLQYVAMRQGKYCSREEIFLSVWEESSECIDQIVNVFVSKIRRKLDDARCGDTIKTVRGLGYMLPNTKTAGL